MTVRQMIINEAKSYNKYLTDEFLNQFDDYTLLNFIHPDNYNWYKQQLEKFN